MLRYLECQELRLVSVARDLNVVQTLLAKIRANGGYAIVAIRSRVYCKNTDLSVLQNIE